LHRDIACGSFTGEYNITKAERLFSLSKKSLWGFFAKLLSELQNEIL